MVLYRLIIGYYGGLGNETTFLAIPFFETEMRS